MQPHNRKCMSLFSKQFGISNIWVLFSPGESRSTLHLKLTSKKTEEANQNTSSSTCLFFLYFWQKYSILRTIYIQSIQGAPFLRNRDLSTNFLDLEFVPKLLAYGGNLELTSSWINGKYFCSCFHSENATFS